MGQQLNIHRGFPERLEVNIVLFRNGEGTIYYNDGKILNGIWEEDELVKKLYSEKSKVNKIKR